MNPSRSLRAKADAELPSRVVSTFISKISKTTPFLRQLPPDTYVSYSPSTQARHLTVLVDQSCDTVPPFTQASLFLRSAIDVSTGDGTSRMSEASALVSLPEVRKVSDGVKFVDRLQALAEANKAASSIPLLHHILLPEFNPFAGNTIGLLQKLSPTVKVVCGPFTAAFLTDTTFYSAVQSLLTKNSSIKRGEIPFAGLSPDLIVKAQHGSSINVLVYPQGSPIMASDGSRVDRQVVVLTGDITKQTERHRRESPHALPHFFERPLFLYDKATRSMLLPRACGQRFPWLHHAVPTARKETCFLTPSPYLHRMGPSSPLSPKEPLQSPLTSLWMPEEELHTTITALRQFSFVQRVIATGYGEISHDRESVIDELDRSTEKIVNLRKRLGGKLFAMTPQQRADLTTAGGDSEKSIRAKLVEKLVAEVLLSSNTVAGEADANQAPEVKEASIAYITGTVLAPIAGATVAGALSLVSSEGKHFAQSLEASQKEPSKPEANQSLPNESATTLKKLFEQRGLASFNAIVDRENIDLDVFLAMTVKELSATFRATFGLTKKLELLQEEIRQKSK